MTWTVIVANMKTGEISHSFVFHGPNDIAGAWMIADNHPNVLDTDVWLRVVALIPGKHPVYLGHLEE